MKSGWRLFLGGKTPGNVLMMLLAGVQCMAAEVEQGKSAKRTASDSFFSQTNIPMLRLQIPEAAISELRQTQWRRGVRPNVSCTVREGTLLYTNVTVHLKGSAGSFRSVDDKAGFTLNFGKAASGQLFHGLEKVSLNNSQQDPSYITDKLCREIYDKAGVPVPRANYVRVRLNQRDMGLYLLTEGWGKDFLKRYYKNVKGNLYDGGFVKDITSQKDVNSGENPDDTSDLKALALAAREPNLARRLAGLESHLDMEKFITMLALDALDWNWDGYGLNHNNYRVFHDLEKDRMVFFPHGMDQMFWKAEGPVAPAMKGLVGRAAMQLPQVRQRYLERMKELMGGVFKLETITNRVAELAARVYPALRGLPDQEEASNYPNQLSILFQRIESRYANIEKQLLGVQQLLKVKKGDAANIKVWDQRSEPNLHTPGARAQGKELELVAGTARGARIWGSTVWLEQGKYRLEGKIKVSGLVPATDPDRAAAPTTEFMNGIMRRFMSASGEPGGAGFRVWTERKQTEGNEWDWFPYRESRNFRRRGLLPASAETGKRISGDMDWTVVTYEFELRQPIADLHILFDLSATKGKAVLDADSVKLIRLSQ